MLKINKYMFSIVASVSLLALCSGHVFAMDVNNASHEESEKVSKCKKAHLYRIENAKTKSSLLLLGSNHAVSLSHVPHEVVEKISYANCLYTEILQFADEASMIAEAKLIMESCEQRLKPKGLFRDSEGVGFLDKLQGDVVPGVRGWFDILKQHLTEDMNSNLDQAALLFGFGDASELFNRFHPKVLPILVPLLKQRRAFTEEEEGMDRHLDLMFRAANKPVYYLETTVDRVNVTLDLHLGKQLESLGEDTTFPSYAIYDLSEFLKQTLLKVDDKPDSLESCIEKMEIMQAFVRKWLPVAEEELEESRRYLELFSHLNEYDSVKTQMLYTMAYIESSGFPNAEESIKRIEEKKLEIAILETRQEGYVKALTRHEHAKKMVQEVLAYKQESDGFIDPRLSYLSGEITQDLLLEDNQDSLVLRNKNWLQVICPLLDQDSRKIGATVGVGHLYGTYGLLQLLSNLGKYNVTRLNLETHTFE